MPCFKVRSYYAKFYFSWMGFYEYLDQVNCHLSSICFSFLFKDFFLLREVTHFTISLLYAYVLLSYFAIIFMCSYFVNLTLVSAISVENCKRLFIFISPPATNSLTAIQNTNSTKLPAQ